jgi:soluble lytic murein transglycosylase
MLSQLNYKIGMNIKRLLPGFFVFVFTACTLHQSPAQKTITPIPNIIFTKSPSTTAKPNNTSTPTITPLPTPAPEILLENGDHLINNGDYLNAQLEFQDALSNTADPRLRGEALWGLGRVEFITGNNGKALIDLQNLANNYPDNPNTARAYFIMGEIFMKLERYSEAENAYSKYLAVKPGVLDSYAQEQRGDAFTASGNFSNAIAAYTIALTSPHIGDDTDLKIKIAEAYENTGDASTAIQRYDAIANSSSNDYVKAQIDLLTGRLFLSQGQTDQGYARFLDAVEKYPMAYDSYSALAALVEANIPVDDMSRGLVDYFAGKYSIAGDAFQRYVTGNPKNDGTAIYYEALVFYELGQYDNAIRTWDTFIANYPDNSHWAAAWNGNSSLPGRAYTQWYWLNQYDIAAQSLLTFIQKAPNDPNAPLFLMEAARIQERSGNLDEAAKTWGMVADLYSNNNLVPQALFLAGISRFRNSKYDQALITFQRNLQLSTAPPDQARAYFWIGKSQQALGNTSLAQNSWQSASALDPTDYYSLRSEDMLLKRLAFDPPPSTNFSVIFPEERKKAEAWLRVTFNLPVDIDLGSPGSLLLDNRLIRGTEYWKLGLQDEARREFEDLRTAVSENQTDSYKLATYLLDLGLYRPAITAFRQVLKLAGMDSQSQTLGAPVYFNHVRYGLYYLDLVLSRSQQAGLDPLFLYSVMRQESLFEGFVRSTAGARGLMQITPDTGKAISENLDWPPDYTSDFLYRPMVSLSFGATYLEQQLLRFDRELYTALAAYNAGPEAAQIWRDLSGSDPDLFLETIRLEETHNYILSVYENFNMYRSLYGAIP